VPRTLSREEVLLIQARGAQIVEVLPQEEYEAAHIAGATSIPLGELRTRARELDPDRAVVTYCDGFQ
jgi:rhodanese-related sulfurtransferase